MASFFDEMVCRNFGISRLPYVKGSHFSIKQKQPRDRGASPSLLFLLNPEHRPPRRRPPFTSTGSQTVAPARLSDGTFPDIRMHQTDNTEAPRKDRKGESAVEGRHREEERTTESRWPSFNVRRDDSHIFHMLSNSKKKHP
jgi:hypothetical protein